MTWLAILAFGKRILSAIGDWLSSLSFWQLVALGLGLLAIIQHFQTLEARHDAAKWQKQFEAVQSQLRRISASRDTQKATTTEKIKVVTRTIQAANDQAKKIETAPLPPTTCHGVTPKEVLNADL